MKIGNIIEKSLKIESGATLKVLYWFFAYPQKEISLSDLSDNLKIAKASASRIVNNLTKEGFLKKEILGRIWRISCNINHRFNHRIKVYYHLTLLSETGIIEKINQKFPNNKSIILFGSYRKGDDTEKSDIDIAIELPENEKPKIIELGKVDSIGYRKNIKVNLYTFSRKKVDLNLFTNIANGIVLQGILEVSP